MEKLRALLRWFLAAICGAVILAIIAGVLGEFFIDWAREHGLYAGSSQKMDAAMTAFSTFVTQSWFLIVAATCLGLTGGLWIDRGLRSLEARKTKGSAPPSKEQLYQLHLRIEEVKRKLLADGILYSHSAEKVSFEAFHEVVAVMVSLVKIGMPAPVTPEYKHVIQYENFNGATYQFLSAISPLLRDGDLAIARSWAKKALEQLQSRALTNPPASPHQAQAPQDTPKKT
jgi:hypothetical protein